MIFTSCIMRWFKVTGAEEKYNEVDFFPPNGGGCVCGATCVADVHIVQDVEPVLIRIEVELTLDIVGISK